MSATLNIKTYKLVWPIKGAESAVPPSPIQIQQMKLRAEEAVADMLKGRGKIIADGVGYHRSRKCWVYEFYIHCVE